MPRCAIFNFSVLFLENRLVTPIRSPNQRGVARNGSENSAKFSPHRAKSTPCLQTSATNEITFLICVKDPISSEKLRPVSVQMHHPQRRSDLSSRPPQSPKTPQPPILTSRSSSICKNWFVSCVRRNTPQRRY